MKREEKQAMAAYEAPRVEVIEVEVERGFAGSDLTPYTTPDNNGGWS